MRTGATGSALLPVFSISLLAACGSEPPEKGKRAAREHFTVVWLEGSPYQMGRQQARLLRDELAEGLEFIHEDIMFQVMAALAKERDLWSVAEANSFPELLDECRGLVDGLEELGWSMDECMLLNFGDVAVECMMHGMPEPPAPGCSQFFAGGPATSDGRLLHGRVLDWLRIQFVIDHPVIFVRRPRGEIPHVVIGFPGNIAPYQGMNAAGLSIASNEIHPPDTRQHALEGRSHVQVLGRMLATSSTLAEARALATGGGHMSHESIAVADGNTGEAEVLELSPFGVDVRALDDGFLAATNHFAAAATAGIDRTPVSGTLKRLERLETLLGPGSELYGNITLEAMASVLRDRLDPWTGIESDTDIFDDNKSIATNGALYAVLFDPARRHFWLSAGILPVPQQDLIGFSLDELLAEDGGTELPVPRL